MQRKIVRAVRPSYIIAKKEERLELLEEHRSYDEDVGLTQFFIEQGILDLSKDKILQDEEDKEIDELAKQLGKSVKMDV